MLLATVLINESKNATTIAVKMPSIWNPLTTDATTYNISPFNTKVNKPRVIIVNGKVSIRSIGLTKALATPSTKAATKAASKPCKVTPSMKFAIKSNPRALIIHIINKPITFYTPL